MSHWMTSGRNRLKAKEDRSFAHRAQSRAAFMGYKSKNRNRGPREIQQNHPRFYKRTATQDLGSSWSCPIARRGIVARGGKRSRATEQAEEKEHQNEKGNNRGLGGPLTLLDRRIRNTNQSQFNFSTQSQKMSYRQSFRSELYLNQQTSKPQNGHRQQGTQQQAGQGYSAPSKPGLSTRVGSMLRSHPRHPPISGSAIYQTPCSTVDNEYQEQEAFQDNFNGQEVAYVYDEFEVAAVDPAAFQADEFSNDFGGAWESAPIIDTNPFGMDAANNNESQTDYFYEEPCNNNMDSSEQSGSELCVWPEDSFGQTTQGSMISNSTDTYCVNHHVAGAKQEIELLPRRQAPLDLEPIGEATTFAPRQEAAHWPTTPGQQDAMFAAFTRAPSPFVNTGTSYEYDVSLAVNSNMPPPPEIAILSASPLHPTGCATSTGGFEIGTSKWNDDAHGTSIKFYRSSQQVDYNGTPFR